jgi:EAL domain-containing protein (putative c-di-GMP-specific phosphodiesterase class I)
VHRGIGPTIERELASRPRTVVTVAIVLLVGFPALRFITDDPAYMLFSVLPITVLGMMFGVAGGLISALISSVAYLVWALTGGESSTAATASTPVIFFILGLVSGVYAGGALGEFDLHTSAARAELRRSIRGGEILFHYQPIAEARTGTVVGLEALARWQHPRLGMLVPADFIEVAEGHEPTMWELTVHGLDRALAEIGQLRRQDMDVPVAVNLSKVILHRDELVAEVSGAMTRHSCPAGGLSVEVTERSIAADHEPAARTLSRLADLGVPAALDDFGSGRSSLAELGSLPIETLKLDLSLFAGWTSDKRGHAIHGIAEFAHALGLGVVAERVEDDELWAVVAEAGSDLVQGDGLSPPLPVDEIAAWLD